MPSIESTALSGMNTMQEISYKLPGWMSYIVAGLFIFLLVGQFNRINRTLIRIAVALETKT